MIDPNKIIDFWIITQPAPCCGLWRKGAISLYKPSCQCKYKYIYSYEAKDQTIFLKEDKE